MKTNTQKKEIQTMSPQVLSHSHVHGQYRVIDPDLHIQARQWLPKFGVPPEMHIEI
jgi:hypothetical protein